MDIKYKFLAHERTEDAPFVGALISAVDCHFNCPGCFNQGLKNCRTWINTEEEIVEEIKKDPINKGIILGGLEWSLQPDEMVALVCEAQKQGLEVMIYTGHKSLVKFFKEVGWRLSGQYYLKVGRYKENLLPGKEVLGAKLASSNQRMYEFTGTGFIFRGGKDEN